jgi:hypothetical protein
MEAISPSIRVGVMDANPEYTAQNNTKIANKHMIVGFTKS